MRLIDVLGAGRWLLPCAILLAGCGGAAAPASSPAAAASASARPASPSAASSGAPASAAAKPSASPSGAAKPAASAGADWDALVAAAKKEGTLAIAMGGDPPAENAVLPAFTKEFGIGIEKQTGSQTTLAQKLIQEKAAGVHSTDVFMNSCSVAPTLGIDASLYAPLKPQLILPEVNDPTKWVYGGPWYQDKDQQYVVRLDRQMRYFFHINPQAVDASQIKTPQDLLKADFKGKIAAFDPTLPGSGGVVGGVILQLMGEDYFKNLYLGQQVKLTNDQRQLGDWLAHNTYPIAIGLPADQRTSMENDGLPIARLKIGDQITADLASTLIPSIVANPPHPNAAKLFVNWALSQEGSQAYADAENTAVTRTDVNYAKVTPDNIPTNGVNYFDDCSWDYNTTLKNQLNDRMKALMPH